MRGYIVCLVAMSLLSCVKPFPDKEFKCPCVAGFKCVDDACRKECLAPDDCAAGTECVSGVCLPPGYQGDVSGQPDSNRMRGDGLLPDAVVPETGSPDGRGTWDHGGDGLVPAGSALLDYYEPLGDDNEQCQGFSDPPANEYKVVHCSFEMAYSQQRTFKVIFFADGAPVAAQEIAWELLEAEDDRSGGALATIDTPSSATNAAGVASVKVTSAEIAGQFSLKATAEKGAGSPPPLYFDIEILPKQAAPLTVKPVYQGGSSGLKFKVYLFQQTVPGTPACSDLDAGKLPPADKASAELSAGQQAEFVSFGGLSPGNPLTYTIVATGYAGGGRCRPSAATTSTAWSNSARATWSRCRSRTSRPHTRASTPW